MSLSPLPVLLCHFFQQFQRFFQFWICSIGLQSLPDAATDMGLQNLLIGAFEQSLGCHDLIGYIHTVAIFLDHLQDTVQLAPRYFQLVGNIAPLGLHAVSWTLTSVYPASSTAVLSVSSDTLLSKRTLAVLLSRSTTASCTPASSVRAL